MDENGKVRPNCANAANPYHVCGAYCLEKIADGKGYKEKDKKILDNRYGIKEVVRNKRTDDGGRSQPNCPKASNPYHECNDNCTQRSSKANIQGVRKESGSKFIDDSRSFDRKKKGSESQPKSPRALEITPALGAIYHGDPNSLESHLYREKLEAENAESFSSFEQHPEEICSQEQSFDKAQIQYSQPLPMSGKIMSPGDTATKFKGEKIQISPKVSSDASTEDGREDVTSSAFSFTGITQALEESDKEDNKSIISESCVSVGKYRVKESISSTLQSIFDKYGDIAANCQLESSSMRAYYLECLCAVVQELQSTPFNELTKSKVKEIFAVLKDVESANIDVSWLRALLNEISEAINLASQRQTFEAKKVKYESSLESVKNELESRMENLSQKEKEAADAREKVAEIKARLDDMEHECSQLDKTISSIASINEKFQGKSLVDELL
ncbi:uncharacterized protein LOC105762939 isoform X2 [Gossypium raimondii]|uniref:Phospholipase-like protein n=1 Tax=Gossypium raimondii TaxID=29730 RepID=A0A0D2TWG0_GOSRA|nr:uncharacterized protein LOC105762939 isoform X2 [Gossypium raimondii]KJB47625.1 hypothetical protein B456_008G036800 [Gossypium raimondii]MBA0591817.1 hypothetical protein [Gossypium raimondii]